MDNVNLLNYLAFTLDKDDDLSLDDIIYIAEFIETARRHIEDKYSRRYVYGVIDGYLHALAYHGAINVTQLLDFDFADAVFLAS